MDLIKEVNVKIKGITPLLMCNERTANPMDPIARKLKEITAVRKKIDVHYEAIQKLSYEGSVYYDDELGIYIPTKWIGAVIRQAAKLERRGKSCAGIVIDEPLGSTIVPYKGKTIEQMWNTMDSAGNRVYVSNMLVRVDKSKVVRTRALFPQWEISFNALINTELLSIDDLTRFLERGGLLIGMGDYRVEKRGNLW